MDILTGSGADVAAVAAEPMEFAAKVARLDAMTEIQSERGLDQCSWSRITPKWQNSWGLWQKFCEYLEPKIEA